MRHFFHLPLPACKPVCCYVLLDTQFIPTAQGAQQIQSRGNGDAVQLQSQIGRGIGAGLISGEPHVTVAEGRAAHQVVERAQRVVIDEAAIGVKIERRCRTCGDLYTRGAQPGGDLSRIGRALYVDLPWCRSPRQPGSAA